jgi:photosystem II stability/assembly factor-like uncharacterized protein
LNYSSVFRAELFYNIKMRMIKTITILIFWILVLTGGLFSQEYQNWKFVHPTPQPNLLRRVDMVDANTWFTVGANGTFMRTTNAGANWYFHYFAGRVGLTYDVSQNYSLWFFNANTGIVAGDRGYIGRTTNAGVTFDSVATGLIIPLNQRAQGIWFFDSNTGFVVAGSASGSGGTILKTVNGGVSWTSSNTTTATAYTSVWGTDAQTVYVVEANGRILKTTDGGSSWVESPNQLVGQFMYDISFINSSTGLITGGGGNIYRTTNAGVSWDSVAGNLNGWSNFQIKIVSATEIYAVGDPSTLFKSTNGGATWQGLPISVSGPSVTYIWYSIDKFGTTLVMTGDYGIVARSTDGGITWNSGNNLHSTALMYDVQTIPGTSKVWVVGRALNGTEKEIFYSSNSGNSWITYDLGFTGDIFSISMVNQQTGYISGQNSKVLKTTNGGANWVMKTQPSGTNYSLSNIEFVDENTGWTFVNFATVAGGNVFKTTNGGDNWVQYSTGGTSENIIAADMVDANTGYCAYNPSNRPVYKTTNGGANWVALTTGLTGNIKDVKAVTGDIVYVCQSSSTQRMAKTTNGGANWTLITIPVVADFTSLDFKDANTGYVCGNSTAAICRTTDGGNTWSFQNAHTITLIKLHVSAGDTAYAIGGNTAILRAAGSSITGVQYNGNVIPKDYSLRQNYPNPFNPQTTIEFSLPSAGKVYLKVFDIAGRQLSSEINGLELNAGNFKLNFDGKDFSSGVYFYSLIVNGALIETKKMLLIK